MKIAIEVLKSRLNADLIRRNTVAVKDPHCNDPHDLKDQKEEFESISRRIEGYEESLRILEVALQSKEMSMSLVQEVSTEFTYQNGLLKNEVKMGVKAIQAVEHIKVHAKVVM